MKKVVLSVSVLIFSVSVNFAQVVTQNNVFVPHDNVFNLGIGTGDYPSEFKTAIPTLSGSYEHCIDIMNAISLGLGGFISYTSYEPKEQYVINDTIPKYHNGILYTNTFHENHIVIAARGTFHYQVFNKLDTYCGLTFGYDLVSHSSRPKQFDKQLDAAIFIGGRYYVSNSFAINAEVSTGISIVTVGASLKI